MEGLQQAVANALSSDSAQHLVGLQCIEKLVTDSLDQVMDELSNTGIIPYIVDLMGKDSHPVRIY